MALALRQARPEVSFAVGGIFLVALLTFAKYLGGLHTYAPAEAAAKRVTVLVSDLLHKRRAFEVILDLVLFAVAYQCAYLLRWEGAPPPTQTLLFARTLAMAVAVKSACFGLLGVYRGHWQHLTLVDAHRVARATVVGTLATIAALTFLFPGGEFSRSIWVLDGMLVALLVTGARAAFRSLDMVRHSLRGEGVPTLIYGAGRGGELAVREMMGNPELALRPVGFVDDDIRKRGRLVHGYPVLAAGDDVAIAVRRYQVHAIVLGSKKITAESLHRLRSACSGLDVRFLQLRLEIEEVSSVSVVPVEIPEARGSGSADSAVPAVTLRNTMEVL
jgi:UDP-GlcNAc:undecaprenyl-phosphate GlcNAc-1-phosphate transferase